MLTIQTCCRFISFNAGSFQFNTECHFSIPHSLYLWLLKLHLKSVDCSLSFISGHHALLSILSIPQKTSAPLIIESVHFFISIIIADFARTSYPMKFFKIPVTTLHSYLEMFSAPHASLLNKHAPLKSISCQTKPQKSFITPNIHSEKAEHSRHETFHCDSRAIGSCKFQETMNCCTQLNIWLSTLVILNTAQLTKCVKFILANYDLPRMHRMELQ